LAAAYVLFPACVALTVHSPALKNVAFFPLTVQTLAVSEAKLTAKAELALADSVSGLPTVCVPGLSNVIVCALVLSLELP
jgi:hypothetical protein